MESPQGLSEIFAHGTSLGSSDIPLGLRPLGKSDDSWEFPRANLSDNPYGLSTVCTKYLSGLGTSFKKENVSKFCSNCLGAVKILRNQLC